MTRRAGRALLTLVAALLGAPLAVGAAAAPLPADAAAGGTVPAATVPAATVPGATAPTADDDDRLPLEVAITDVAPGVLEPGQDLRVTVRVRNAGTTPVSRPRVMVSLDRSSFVSRSSLDRWREAGDDGGIGSLVAQVDLEEALAPGASVTTEVVVTADQVRLPRRATAWGARGLAVTVVDRDDAARRRLGVARTFVVWFPPQELNATRVSVLVPLVGPAVDAVGGTWRTRLDEATADGGRLADVLAATEEHPFVTWLLDPWLLEAAPSAGTSSRAWAGRLGDGLTDREVQLLPYLDPDLAALAHTGRTELLTQAVRRGEDAARAAGLPAAARVRLALPATVRPDLATAGLAARTDLALVVGPGELLPPAVLTYTPSGRTTLTASGRSVPVLVADERLSSALVTGRVAGRATGTLGADDAPAEEVPDDAGSGPVTAATAAQDLLAELAVITRERPSDSRHVLLTVPRDWSPDPERADAQLAALASAPWVRPEPVSALAGLADPEIDRGTLPTREVAGTEIDSTVITALQGSVQRREAVAAMVPDPAPLLGDGELEVLAALGVAWRADTVGRDALVGASDAVTAAITDGVSVEATSDILNLISTSGAVPVHVRNDLDQPVDVTVGLRPSDPRLRADETVPVTVPPESQVLVQIPVHAVQSADMTVTVEVRTAGGVLVDEDTAIPIRVRAEWEGIGMAVLGSLLAIGLVIGIVRTIRRGRGERRAAPEPEAGPDALSPEEVAEARLAAAEPRPDGA
jgi:hypothetical protein